MTGELYWWSGENGEGLLEVIPCSGHLTDDPTCCDCDECCCTRFNDAAPPIELRARVVAPGCPEIDGITANMSKAAEGEGQCQLYTLSSGWSGDCDPPTNMGLQLYCPDDGDSCRDYRLNMIPGNSGCKNLATNINVEPTLCDCGSDVDKAYFIFDGFSLVDDPPKTGCACCAGPFRIVIEEI